MNKKPPRIFRGGFLTSYDDILFLVALSTAGGVLHAESLGAVVASTAELSGLHILHGHYIAALLHLEKTRLMAISTLEALVGVDLAVKNHLAGALRFEINGLAGWNCESRDGEDEGYNYYDRYDEKLFHYDFTSFHREILKRLNIRHPGYHKV